MKLLIGAVGGVLLGAGAMWGVTSQGVEPEIVEIIPDGYYDLSSMPDELEAKFADEAFIAQIVQQEKMKEETLAKMRAAAAARSMVSLPDGVPEFPFEVAFFEPEDGHGWPVLEDPAIQAMLDAEKHNWVVLNYWATWCAPCIHELPDMNNASTRLEEVGVSLIALNADPLGKDTPGSVEAFLIEKGIDVLTNATVAGADIKNAMAAGSMSIETSFSYPHNIVFAPGGIPYGYFQGLPIPKDNSPIWNSDEMISFFGALVESEAT
ncbi:MAG: TlpA disulfide reductase family protein [Pseudomonadota bacterium]